MILALTQRHRRKIAAVLLYILFIQQVVPCMAGERLGYPTGTNRGAYTPVFIHPPAPGNPFPVSLYHPPVVAPKKIAGTSPAPAVPKRVVKKYNGGPGQPEQKSFQSVNAQNMVDLFSGDFSYNIPLLDVGGYPINIHYRSGISMDQEASWVGLGWNLNPGSINRNMRGVPDDFNGDIISKTQYTRPNWTAGINLGADPEFFGFPAGLSANAGFFYNNYRGLGFEVGAGINVSLTSAKGAEGGLSSGLGLNLNNNSQNGFTIEPSFELNRTRIEQGVKGISNGFSIGASFSTRRGLQDLTISSTGTRLSQSEKDNTRWNRSAASTFSGSISFAHPAYTPSVKLPYTSYQFNFSLKLGGEFDGFHPLGSIGGYYSRQYIAKSDTTINVPAHGYMYLQNGYKNPGSMLDFNREKELPAYTANPPSPHLPVPNYTYDIYSINGEGTGGMFRPCRGDIGYMRDPVMRSKSGSGGFSVDFGGGNVVHGGADARFSLTTTSSGAWTGNNQLTAQNIFRNADSTYENVYFRNPAEKSINAQSYYDRLGDTKVLQPVMSRYDDPSLTTLMQPYANYVASGATLSFGGTLAKTTRDKRSQVISFLTARDASSFGLDTAISNYPFNTFIPASCNRPAGIVTEQRINDIRKPHHFSELTVLNNDGKRYVYGIPVYNIDQEEVSFSASKSQVLSDNLVQYQPAEASTGNHLGKDNYFERGKVPAYASAFLITGLVSADYTDRTGDGITDDDQGDAVKFNYTKLYGAGNLYRWRSPYGPGTATYQEGLKTDTSDDKGSYVYGTKEIWYLNSVITKTMIATFTLNDPAKGEQRQDGYGVLGENGGLDATQSLRYLKQIDLYSKADYLNFINNGKTPTPVKTVHFSYSYRLCPGAPGSLGGQGKLTLDSIWFSYNGNDKGRQNPYVFNYHVNNPAYNNSAYDRWGNYKDKSANPTGLSNADYPYSMQAGVNGWDSAHAASNAAAWTLDSIKLPSTGTIKIAYESDDYAYVQNKRATQMMQLAGFGSNSQFTGDQHLYNGNVRDYDYVFIRVPDAATSATDVYNKYLQGIDKIYFTYRVKMPSDVYGNGYEHVSVYAQYDTYGVSTSDPNIIWVHLKSAESGPFFISPLAKAAIQALRLNLPSKAYPGSDLNGEFDAVALGRSLIGFITNFGELVSNFATRSRMLGNAGLADVNSSFARLNNPAYKKLGGGLRVKRITISDNFSQMTGQKTSNYGQEYDYSTIQTINGIATRISSGVATWEPSIGNEENPFRTPIEYATQVSPLAPSNNMYSENPLGEGYFPSAQVGYSKVRVHTINNKVASANGYEESEFYTSYDFPTLTEQTPLDERKFRPSFLSSLFKIDAKSYLAQAQGFKVETNDMNGREKATASYPENDPYNPLSYTKYYYKTDNDSAIFKHLSNTVAVVDSVTGHINPAAQVGKDIEVMVDVREENTQTDGGDAEFNVDAFILGIFPLSVPTAWAFPQSEAQRYRSVSTMKLVQRYGILNKVMHYEKGSLVTTENLLFDAETGEPLLNRTQNEFNDPVYQFSYPAHWAYSGMEPAYKNIGAVFSNVTFSKGKITAPGYNNVEKFFESGDEIMVRSVYNKTGSTPNINDCTGEGSCASPLYSTTANDIKLWAISGGRIQNNKGFTGIYFIDRWGNFFNSSPGQPVTIQILRSGKRNMAGAAIGSVQSLASPMRLVGGQWKLVFDDQTRIVNTSATAFNDFWKVEEAKFSLSTTIVSKTPALKTALLYPVNALSAYWVDPKGPEGGKVVGMTYNPPYFESVSWYHHPNGGWDDGVTNSWLEFDLKNKIPASATIVTATLSLRPHYDVHNVQPGSIGDLHNHTATNPHSLSTTGNHDDNLSVLAQDLGGLVNNSDWSTLAGGSTSTWLSVFDGSYMPGPAARIQSSNKQNSVLTDVRAIVQQGLANSTPRFILKMLPLYSYRAAPPYHTHNDGRYCFWATDATTGTCQLDAEPGGYSHETKGPQCPTGPVLKIEYNDCAAGSQQQQICDTLFCISTSTQTNCRSNITDTTVNPYLFGALGNWRPARSYVYYDNRKEYDFSQSTDIRNNGTITGFLPYWSFTTARVAPATDTVKWVWNTESTLFNKRGLELENHNALNIYNAAQYGYNQSLPVAVTQNAAYREQAYDGFEDYNFPNAQTACNGCVLPRHIYIDSTATNITTAEAHSGKYSMYIGPGHKANGVAPVVATDTAPRLNIRLDTLVIPAYTITPNGPGLADTLYRYFGATSYMSDNYGLDNYNYSTGPVPFGSPRPVPNSVNYDGKTPNTVTGTTNLRYYKVVWQGALLTDMDMIDVLFEAATVNSFKLWINGQIVIDAFSNDPGVYNGGTSFAPALRKVNFRRGKIYNIRVEQEVGNQVGMAQLLWSWSGRSFQLVPHQYLYPSVAAAQAAIQTNNITCVNWNGITDSSLLYKELAPTVGSKIVFSAWVKEQQNCHCNSYTHAYLQAYFWNSQGVLFNAIQPVRPSGNIIEGWQRIETYITIPAGTTRIQLIFGNDNTGGYTGLVYFDDIRVHPFNGEMKSYVYDDLNLRLMAQLDENNYASFYEYDDDGSLVRVKKETEEGIKTIKETRNALVK